MKKTQQEIRPEEVKNLKLELRGSIELVIKPLFKIVEKLNKKYESFNNK